MSDEKRERAIQLVYSLTLLAEHPNTPQHEAAAAQARITHLRARYNLTAKDDRDEVAEALKREQAKQDAAHEAWRRQQTRAPRTNQIWDTTTKYHATITHASEGFSRNGNLMVTINYRISTPRSRDFKGWYVMTNDHGKRALARVFVTLMGEESLHWPTDTAMLGLHGMSCTVMLETWGDENDQWKVGIVMPRWS